MQKLPTLFSPDRIFDMDDHDVTRFAGEDQSGESERTRCQEKQEILVKALVQLRQVDMHRLVRPSGMEKPFLIPSLHRSCTNN
jgi:hypothetical protein